MIARVIVHDIIHEVCKCREDKKRCDKCYECKYCRKQIMYKFWFGHQRRCKEQPITSFIGA